MNHRTAVVDFLLDKISTLSITDEFWSLYLHRPFGLATSATVHEPVTDLYAAWTSQGRMPLMIAARHDRLDVVEVLLENHKVDINAQSLKGLTALDHAIWRRNHALVEELIAHGSSLQLFDPYGRNAYSRAAFSGSRATLNVLLAVPSMKSDHAECFGRTLLWWAAAGN
ncbi:hypothetical protein NX059_000028 [Plenodomus lindquistii]|nr:hypothetical protein NX059_000028 [Plenodomus lindquistii]